MADVLTPIPEELVATVRALLRGDRSVWPTGPHDEARFLQALDEHGIAPLLFNRAPDWPGGVVAALRERAVRAAALEPFRLHDLRSLLDALAARGIDVLVVKGSALAYSLYPSPDLRPRADTDLLLDRAHLGAAREVFRDLGYVESVTSGDELAYRQAMFTRHDAAGVDHVYDVHWAIANTPVFAEVLRFDELRSRSVALPRIGDSARTICDVDALLYACIHRVAHHHDSERLIWLADIDLLRARMPRDAHARFWALAAERSVVGVCIRSIEVTREWFGGEEHDLASDFLDLATLAREEPTRASLVRGRRAGAVLRDELAALRGWRARAKRIRQLAFPPAAYLRAQFGTRSRLSLPWLYAYRAARGVARLFRRVP